MPTPAKTPIPSQCDRILSMLKAGKTLTTYELHIMGIQSPTTRMMELRRAGYPIIFACFLKIALLNYRYVEC